MKDDEDKKDELNEDEEEQDLESSDEDELDEEIDLDDEDLEDEEEKDSEDSEDKSDEEDEDEDEDEFDEKDLDDPEKRKNVLALIKKSKSAMKQRAKWKARALKAEKDKEKPSSAKPPKKVSSGTKNQEAIENARRYERNEFRLDHPDIPRRMVDEIQKHAIAHGMTMEKTLRRPLIQRFVNDKKLKERLSKASPSSRHRSPQSAPTKDWSRATSAEVAAHEAEIRQRTQK